MYSSDFWEESRIFIFSCAVRSSLVVACVVTLHHLTCDGRDWLLAGCIGTMGLSSTSYTPAAVRLPCAATIAGDRTSGSTNSYSSPDSGGATGRGSSGQRGSRARRPGPHLLGCPGRPGNDEIYADADANASASASAAAGEGNKLFQIWVKRQLAIRRAEACIRHACSPHHLSIVARSRRHACRALRGCNRLPRDMALEVMVVCFAIDEGSTSMRRAVRRG